MPGSLLQSEPPDTESANDLVGSPASEKAAGAVGRSAEDLVAHRVAQPREALALRGGERVEPGDLQGSRDATSRC